MTPIAAMINVLMSALAPRGMVMAGEGIAEADADPGDNASLLVLELVPGAEVEAADGHIGDDGGKPFPGVGVVGNCGANDGVVAEGVVGCWLGTRLDSMAFTSSWGKSSKSSSSSSSSSSCFEYPSSLEAPISSSASNPVRD